MIKSNLTENARFSTTTTNGCGCGHDHTHYPGETASEPHGAAPSAGNDHQNAGGNRVRYRVDNMDCPVEEQLIRARLEKMPGIERLDFNLIDRELTVYHRLQETSAIFAALRALDMAPRLLDAGGPLPEPYTGLSAGKKALLLISGLAAAGAETVAWLTGRDSSGAVLALAILSLLCAGLPSLKKGLIALRYFTLNIHFLMTVAVAGAMGIGNYPEAAMVVFLFALAEAIEGLSLEKVRDAIRTLSKLVPETADVWSGGGWVTLRAAEVTAGSLIRIRTGARVPLDCRAVSGRASLNQAPITGESLPVDKQTGDPLYAGSIVMDGVVEAEVTAVAGESTLARLAAAVQEAQSQRAPMQRTVDRFARYYTPVVVVCAVLAALCGPLLYGGTRVGWLYQALVMLVIACPCALVLSTPVTVVSGLAAAARRGILIKGGVFLEGGRLLKTVALDKTGTLTWGKPALTDVIPCRDLPGEEALLLAASLGEHSTHPISQAMVSGWRGRQPANALLTVTEFRGHNGLGVTGSISGTVWRLGNERFVAQPGTSSPGLESLLAALEQEGKTTAVLCDDRGPVAVFGLADTVRPESAQAVAELKALGVVPVMLTGDNQATARAIAGQLGIEDARGALLPEDKLTAIAGLQEYYGAAGMVGDGVNDAPALARADIGIAMGAAGTAAAVETADVAIMDDDPRKIAGFIRLSRRCAMILNQNITLALSIKAVFLALALSGRATLWMAVFADMGASLLVVCNGLRLMGFFARNTSENWGKNR